jgi:hypothetical protein
VQAGVVAQAIFASHHAPAARSTVPDLRTRQSQDSFHSRRRKARVTSRPGAFWAFDKSGDLLRE